MECFRCRKKARINLKHLGRLCNNCFLKLIEKRVRKELRTKKLIKKDDRILFIDDNSKEFFVCYFLLKSIIKELPVKIETKKTKKLNLSSNFTKKYDKIIIPWNLEDEAEGFLELVFNKKKQPRFSKKAIKLLKNLSEEEIKAFARIKGFSYKTKPKSRIKKMLDELEQRYPGYKFSLLNSTKQMQKL